MAAADSPAPDSSASAEPGDADRKPAASAAGSGEPADVKARFRDALERKKDRHADGVGGGGPSSGKVSDVHSRAGGKRQFRRKSGG
jgi:hypothetical protein